MNQSWTSADQVLKAYTFQRSASTIFGVFFSSASDDINIRQTRWPKGEVDENRVKKSAQAKLTFFVVITDHIIIICGMVYGITRRNLLEMKINPVKVYAQYFIPNLTLILWRPIYVTVRDLGINMNQPWISSDQLIKAHTFKWSTSTICGFFSATDDIKIRRNKMAQRGGGQEKSQEVWASSAHIQCVGSVRLFICFNFHFVFMVRLQICLYSFQITIFLLFSCSRLTDIPCVTNG